MSDFIVRSQSLIIGNKIIAWPVICNCRKPIFSLPLSSSFDLPASAKPSFNKRKSPLGPFLDKIFYHFSPSQHKSSIFFTGFAKSYGLFKYFSAHSSIYGASACSLQRISFIFTIKRNRWPFLLLLQVINQGVVFFLKKKKFVSRFISLLVSYFEVLLIVNVMWRFA